MQNSTNVVARDIVCRGGNGIAVGSLGQYVDLVSIARLNRTRCMLTRAPQPDIVDHLTIENVQAVRLDPEVQPNMGTGIYLKTWTDTVNGVPPTGGGGGGGDWIGSFD